jgi:uridine kinase
MIELEEQNRIDLFNQLEPYLNRYLHTVRYRHGHFISCTGTFEDYAFHLKTKIKTCLIYTLFR